MKLKSGVVGSFIYAFAGILIVLLTAIGLAIIIPEVQSSVYQSSFTVKGTEDTLTLSKNKLSKEVDQLQRKLDRTGPGNVYLVINTTNNSFRLYKKNHLERQGICSTGSYIELVDGNEKQFRFETPKGVFTVRNKILDPVWKKPDWAFIEDGLPIPPPNDPSRFEYGVLGDYALDIGNGYLIHGTLYQRFLGLPVTHGCVRLNDSDLEFVYNNMPVGGKVFIY